MTGSSSICDRSTSFRLLQFLFPSKPLMWDIPSYFLAKKVDGLSMARAHHAPPCVGFLLMNLALPQRAPSSPPLHRAHVDFPQAPNPLSHCCCSILTGCTSSRYLVIGSGHFCPLDVAAAHDHEQSRRIVVRQWWFLPCFLRPFIW